MTRQTRITSPQALDDNALDEANGDIIGVLFGYSRPTSETGTGLATGRRTYEPDDTTGKSATDLAGRTITYTGLE